ncbi:hypothetical protein A3K80_03895 [Candidatus Bathyarchaeota archaeon RBG_13_38_9]|nr:MAG: hypothetical protein A3K80_03895 [Candidatus Bathyarchaeota archaeon RBG_13_38_9]
MTNVYIDSDVIVASEIQGETNWRASKKFMDYVLKNENPNYTFTISVFTFLELASAMIRRTKNKDKAYSLLYKIKNSWKDSIKPLPPLPTKKATSFTRLVDTLIETSIRFRTPSGDSIHAQTVAINDIQFLVTWNKNHYTEMAKQITKVKILNPTEALTKFGNSNDVDHYFIDDIDPKDSEPVPPKDFTPEIISRLKEVRKQSRVRKSELSNIRVYRSKKNESFTIIYDEI